MLSVLTACASKDAAPKAEQVPTAPCKKVRPGYPCRTITVGERVFRYMVLDGAGKSAAAGAAPSKNIALVDLGGPGGSVFGGNAAIEMAAAWPTRDRLLFLEEPWVSRELTSGCRSSLASFQLALRSSEPIRSQSKALVDACALGSAGGWGWTANLYGEVVRKIVAVEGGRLSGVVASSYGAIRTREIQREATDWLVLNSPAPRHRDGAGYLTERRALAQRSLASACRSCAPNAVPQILSKARASLVKSPISLPYRTPPVTATDLDAAVVGAAYLTDDDRAEFVTRLRSNMVKAAVTIGKQSDSLLLRYGEYSMSAGFLSYLDEVCRDYGPWRVGEPVDQVDSLLRRLHTPCTILNPNGKATAEMSPSGAPTCVATGTADFVVARATADDWAKVTKAAERVEMRGKTHADFALAVECAKRLARH